MTYQPGGSGPRSGAPANGPGPTQPRKHRHDDEEQGKLFVGGLSWDTTQDSLLRYFSQFGEVIDCVVMKNAESGRSRGFGFVTFSNPSNIETVLSNCPHNLDGRTIDPKACNPRSMQKPKKPAGQVGQQQPVFPKVFLGGLPSSITETDLRNFFSRYGEVVEVVIMYDQEKKKSRGFGFLSFGDENACGRAVQEHYVNIQNKQVEIKRAEPRTNQPPSNAQMDKDPSAAAQMMSHHHHQAEQWGSAPSGVPPPVPHPSTHHPQPPVMAPPNGHHIPTTPQAVHASPGPQSGYWPAAGAPAPQGHPPPTAYPQPPPPAPYASGSHPGAISAMSGQHPPAAAPPPHQAGSTSWPHPPPPTAPHQQPQPGSAPIWGHPPPPQAAYAISHPPHSHPYPGGVATSAAAVPIYAPPATPQPQYNWASAPPSAQTDMYQVPPAQSPHHAYVPPPQHVVPAPPAAAPVPTSYPVQPSHPTTPMSYPQPQYAPPPQQPVPSAATSVATVKIPQQPYSSTVGYEYAQPAGTPTTVVVSSYPAATVTVAAGTTPATSTTAAVEGTLGPQRGGVVYGTQPSPYHPYRRTTT